MKKACGFPWRRVLAACVIAAAAAPVPAETIVDEWASVKAPPAPELKPVTVDPKTTALLVLDLIQQNCNNQRRPRCVASVPKVSKFLAEARGKGVFVVYSLFPNVKASDILKEIAPLGGEPIVASTANKYLGTDLDKILKDRGIKSVILVGAAAHGAVLYTGSEAAQRGFQVVVPVDGMSAENTYAEQLTAWQLTNAPTVGNRVTLTKMDLIRF